MVVSPQRCKQKVVKIDSFSLCLTAEYMTGSITDLKSAKAAAESPMISSVESQGQKCPIDCLKCMNSFF